MKKVIAIFYLIIALCLFGQTKIVLVETSDVHGAIYPWNFILNKEAGGSLSRVKTFIDSLRKADNVVLLDNGDILQGSPAVYYYNFVDTKSEHLYASVMNYMEYDVATVGNHDIEPGHAVYDKFVNELNFPWLAANIIDTETGKPYFKPYHVIEIEGKKIAVLGMITPGVPNWLPENIWSGMSFQDKVECARAWLPVILEKEKPDLMVGLFHAGAESHGKTIDDKNVMDASMLVAEHVPGFDIVFVGHDHRGWNKTIKNSSGEDVLVIGPTSKARNVAVAEVTFDDKSEKGVTITSELVDLKHIEPDQELLKKFSKEYDLLKEYVNQQIGVFSEDLLMQDAIFSNASIMDLIHNVQLELTGADVSFAAPLSLTSKIKKGPVHVRDMFNLYKYENLLYTMELSGKEIKDFLEYAYELRYNTMKSENDHLIAVKDVKKKEGRYRGYSAFKNVFYSFDDAEGIDYTVDVSKPAGERVAISGFTNGVKFQTDKKYKVAVNSYRGSGGGGHFTIGAGIPHEKLQERIIKSTDKDLRFYIMEWIKKNKTIEVKETKNWKVIPEDFFREGKARDQEYIFVR